MRIALGKLSHEANTFSPLPTTWDDFSRNWMRRGPEILRGLEGLNIEEAGAVEILRAEPGCEILPTFAAHALSGYPVDGPAFRRLLDELLTALRAALPVDGVLLVLHGAMMAEGEADASGAVLQAVRQMVGSDVPIVGTLDLHANVTVRMAEQATALIGYHTAPHIDMAQTGRTAARILLGAVKKELHPQMALVRLPLLVPAENSRHTEGPLSEVINMALALEKQGTILHGGIYPVQPWMDTPDVGCSVVVVTDDDPAAARAQAGRLAREFWARRAAFVPSLLTPSEAVQNAIARERGTVVLCDSADAPSSGATGDSTVILHALLDRAPIQQTCLLNVVDSPAVAQAIAAGVGNNISLSVGGKLAPIFFQPVVFNGYVKTISDGVFSFKGPGMRGVAHRMGRTVVLVQGGIHLVVMEHAVTQWDPQLYRSLGLEPTDARIVQVKSPAAFRAAYQGIMDDVLIVASPGAASADLTHLPWKHIRRPLYPLDPDIRWP
jgi:microcystin degradation protein MlrC